MAREGCLTELEESNARQREVRELRRALQRDPNSLRFAELADLLRRQGNLREATAVCARGLQRHPAYATGRVVMGEIFWDQKLEEKAQQEWLEALRVDPGHPRARLVMGRACLRRGDLARARLLLESALLWNPESPEVRDLLAGLPDQEPCGDAGAAGHSPTARGRLSAQRMEELFWRVSACPSVATAAVASPTGLPMAGPEPPDAIPGRAIAAAVELVRVAVEMTARLGLGQMRSALLRGWGGSVRAIRVGDATLVACLTPEALLGAADLEISEAIAGFQPAG